MGKLHPFSLELRRLRGNMKVYKIMRGFNKEDVSEVDKTRGCEFKVWVRRCRGDVRRPPSLSDVSGRNASAD